MPAGGMQIPPIFLPNLYKLFKKKCFIDQNRINNYKDKVINTKKLIYVFFSFPCDGY